MAAANTSGSSVSTRKRPIADISRLDGSAPSTSLAKNQRHSPKSPINLRLYTKAKQALIEKRFHEAKRYLGQLATSNYAGIGVDRRVQAIYMLGKIQFEESSYLPAISNLTKVMTHIREKVGSDKGKLVPTDIGNIVNDFLVEHFDKVLDFGFTARVESEFDEIADGKEDWFSMIKEFYQGFHTRVEDVAENADRAKGERLLGVDPESGKNVYVRLGRYGAMVQIGEASDEEKPKFASLQGEQTMNTITFEEALDLFKLPKTVGTYEGDEVVVANGRFGPYVRFGKMFVSLDKGENPMSVDVDRAIELIEKKRKADAPIGTYQDLPIQKGVGRFGPFIKWNSMFINVNKKYDFDNLSQADLEELIEDKLKKEREKLIYNWEDVGIRVEKARWGRFSVIKGKTKVELPKTTNIEKFSKEDALSLIESKTKKKKK